MSREPTAPWVKRRFQALMPNSSVFSTPEGVAFALRRYRDVFEANTSSVIGVSRDAFDPSRGPFRSGFIAELDEREELRRRMAERIAARERELLFLWYVADLPPTRVATSLGISRIHAYRLRNGALTALCDADVAS